MRSIAISKSCWPTSVGAATGGRERRLVDHLGEVGPDHARGALGEHQEVRVVRELHLADVDLQDLLPAPQVGPVHHDLAVEAPGAEQRLVEHLRAVGGGHDHDAGGGLEAVHLDEELVERLLALVVGGHGGDAAARLADRVELVDEDDAGGALARLLEEVAHARRPEAHEHLHELGPGEREERHPGLAGHRLGEQRLAGARGAHQEHPLGDARAEGGVLLRVLQEVHHLDELGLGLVHAGHVVEGDLPVARRVVDDGLVLADRQRPAAPALHPPHQEEPDAAPAARWGGATRGRRSRATRCAR